jgi:hypothetical protein
MLCDSPQIGFLVFFGQIAEGNIEQAIGLSLTIMMCSHVILCLQALYVTSSNVTW